MVEKLQIRGFGANEKLDVEFGPHVTSIVGKNFIGKSWLLRALKWVCLNKPAGDAYINWDSNEAKVRMSIDSKKVIHIRSKSDNSYRLSGRTKPYTGFGNEVPKDIAEIINLSELNFQGQHSTKENRIPFWFSETAGEVSRQLNSIVNLEIIDKTLANIDSEKRKASTLIEVVEQSLTKAVQEKKELVYVKDLDEELKSVEKLQSEYEKIRRECATIDELVNQAESHKSVQENRLKLVSDTNLAVSAGDKCLKIVNSVEKLSKLIESAQNFQSVLDNRPPSIKPLEKLRDKSKALTSQCLTLQNLITIIQHRRERKCKAERELQKLKRELEEIAEGRCLLCGAKLKS